MRLLAALLYLVTLLSCVACHADSQRPEATFDLAKLLPDVVTKDSVISVDFLTDKTFALCLHSQRGTCRIYIFEWRENGLRDLTQAGGVETGAFEQFIHRVGTDHLLSTTFVYYGSSLYSMSLQLQKIPHVDLRLTPTSGRVAATSGGTSWTVYRLIPTATQLRQGSGELLSVSDDMLAIRREDKIHIETLDGKDLGSFAVKPETKCFTDVKFLNAEALLLNPCSGHQSIIDFTGKKLVKISVPRGNPLNVKTNDAGTRLLFDHATRDVSILQSSAELALTIATGNAGEELDNGEAVRVIDTKTGNICFDWQARLPEKATDHSHADISPSGNFVAIANGAILSFIRLPDQCSSR